jgi:hypothetical protein
MLPLRTSQPCRLSYAAHRCMEQQDETWAVPSARHCMPPYGNFVPISRTDSVRSRKTDFRGAGSMLTIRRRYMRRALGFRFSPLYPRDLAGSVVESAWKSCAYWGSRCVKTMSTQAKQIAAGDEALAGTMEPYGPPYRRCNIAAFAERSGQRHYCNGFVISPLLL